MKNKIKNVLVRTEMDIPETQNIGFKRFLTQVGDTITFEVDRNLKSFVIILLIYVGVFILTLIGQEILYLQSVPLPENPIDYISNYLGNFGLLTMLSTIAFAGSIIAEDFQRQTSNMVFPKIRKMRLLLGRITSRFGLIVVCSSIYYILIASITFFRYLEVPIVIWNSWGWALLYALMIFSFVTFMSSIMRSTALSIVISLVFLYIVFSTILSVVMLAGGEYVEPLFIPIYYEGIIIASMNMPSPRYETFHFPLDLMGGGGGETLTIFTWITPNYLEAFIGMFLFIILFQGLAILLYKRRQSKN